MGFHLSKSSVPWRHSQMKTLSDKESSLRALPMELLQYISATFLPSDAAASLALCSRSMLRILGTQAFHCLGLECHIVEKTRFLENLEKELLNWLLCHHCSKFHPVNRKADPSQRWYHLNETECARVNGFVPIRHDYTIRYEHTQLIMRNFRLRRPYELYLKRLSKKYARHFPDTGLESAVTADIVEGELLIQIKHTLRLRKNSDMSLIRVMPRELCRHLVGRHRDSIFAQSLRCRLSHASNLPCSECKKRKHCPNCSTSFQVDIRMIETFVTEVCVNIWRCLGSCESPLNPKWRAQADRCLASRRPRE